MIYSILYAALAVFALGFLVFVHELGHYFVARREKMRVEAFSIGFGKPLLAWKRQGVHWQIGWIPFGGYVKIAGMDNKDSFSPPEDDSYFAKSPWARIRVAVAGPLINIILAFVLFTIIWMTGGREKPFSDSTHMIGWVEPSSGLYQAGIRSGDVIETYAGKPFTGYKQMFYAALLDHGPYTMTGEEIDYLRGVKKPFSYTLDFQSLSDTDKISTLMQTLSPASYLIYDEAMGNLQDSPMKDSGIQNGDRVLWIDGEVIFSRRQLSSLINQPRVLLTVARGDEIFLTRVPRLQIRDLRLDSTAKADLQDVEYALGIRSSLANLYYVPYTLTDTCEVQNVVSYIDENASEKKYFEPSGSSIEIPLISGDRILSVDGAPIQQLHEFFSAMQTRHVQVVVVRGENYGPLSWKKADQAFVSGVSFADLNKLTASIGTSDRLSNVGDLYLLNPVVPKPRYEFPLTYSLKERITEAVSSQKKQKQGKDVSEERSKALKLLEDSQNQVMLGLPLKDRMVNFNPSPVQMMVSSLQEAWKTLYATITGYTSPKYLAGPVGMVEVIHHGWADGSTEVVFLIAVISLNLGILNLLPIPILDGGHICFYLFEIITGKKIKAKTMEKLIIPFIVLFVAFFIYLTYQDILRLLSRFF